MELLLVFVVGAALGGVIGRLVTRATQSGDDVAVQEARHQAQIAEVRQASASEHGQVAAQLAAREAAIEGLHRELDNLRDQLKERASIDATENKVLQQMAPIAKNLADMKRTVADLEQQRAAQHGEIAAQISATRETAEKSKAAAEMLNSALRNNQQRGAYGEMQLKNIVEAAGLLRRVDFSTQESINADSGARRPDMIVKLPGGKEMVVDAKVPFAAYIESHRADVDDATRATLLKDHAKQVRAHVNALADKSYFTGLKVSPEYTIAFIPTDAILDAALEADGTLMDYAFSRGIALATPVNLFTVLKTVAFTWRQDDIAENAREVVEMGQEMFRRLRKTAEHAAKVGRSLTSAVTAYNTFAGSLERSVLPQARKFDHLDIPDVREVEADVRQFTAREFTALELSEIESAAFEDLQRPELPSLDEPSVGDRDEERSA